MRGSFDAGAWSAGHVMSPAASPNRVSIGTPQRQQQQQQQQLRHEHMMRESRLAEQQQQQLYSQPSTIDPALLQQLLHKMHEMELGL